MQCVSPSTCVVVATLLVNSLESDVALNEQLPHHSDMEMCEFSLF